MLLVKNIDRATLASDILRTLGRHTTKPALNADFLGFVGQGFDTNSDLSTIKFDSASEEKPTPKSTASYEDRKSSVKIKKPGKGTKVVATQKSVQSTQPVEFMSRKDPSHPQIW